MICMELKGSAAPDAAWCSTSLRSSSRDSYLGTKVHIQTLGDGTERWKGEGGKEREKWKQPGRGEGRKKERVGDKEWEKDGGERQKTPQ